MPKRKPVLAVLDQARVTSKVTYTTYYHKHDRGLFGETCFDSRQIRLHTEQSDYSLQSTYLHELLHAVSHEFGADLTEGQVRALEKGLMTLLRLNPKLFKI